MNTWHEDMHTCAGELADLACYLLGSLIKLAAVAAVLLSPVVVEWLLDGCPSPDEAIITLVEDVKGGWR